MRAIDRIKLEKYDTFYMDVAYRTANLSHAIRRKVGAVAAVNGNIVAHGFNGTPAGYPNKCEDDKGNTLSNVIHAEDNLIRKSHDTGTSLKDAVVYVTKEPCIRCAKLLAIEGVSHIIYVEKSESNPEAFAEFVDGWMIHQDYQKPWQPPAPTPKAPPVVGPEAPGDANEERHREAVSRWWRGELSCQVPGDANEDRAQPTGWRGPGSGLC